VLAGTVVLSGRTTGYVNVRLPAPAGLDNPAAGRSGATFAGGGRHVGFFLMDDRPNGVRLLGGHAEGSRLTAYMHPLQGLADGPTFRLPAGNYRLYLLADGAPATVTLRLKGLGGRVALTPSRRVPSELRSPAATVAPPVGANVAYGGAEGTLPGRGVAFDFLRTVNTQFTASNTQLCFYTEKPPAAPLAYAPGCPRALFASTLTVVSPGGVGTTEGAAFSASADLPAGQYAQGFNIVAVAVADSFRYTAGFFSYE
jgi:hypothetical protein